MMCASGYDMAGTVEAVGANVTRFKPGDEVFGGVRRRAGRIRARARARRHRPQSRRNCRSKKPPAFRSPRSPRCRACAITATSPPDRRCSSMALPAAWEPTPCRSRSRSAPKSPAYAARATWSWCARSARITSSTTRRRTSPKATSATTSSSTTSAIMASSICDDVVKPDGIIVVVGGSKKEPFLGPIKRVAWSKIAGALHRPAAGVLHRQREQAGPGSCSPALVREGKLKTVIDRRYPLEEAGAALDYLGSGHARGKVIVTVD